MVEKKQVLKLLVISTLIGVVVLLFLLVFISFFLYLGSGKVSEKGSSKLHQYYQFDPSTNRTRGGFVSLQNELGDEDFISYQVRENGNLVLISNFETRGYVCRKTCYCEESGEEGYFSRRTSSVISRSMVYLVAAVSSFVAYEKARLYFENQCLEMGDKCALHSEISSDWLWEEIGEDIEDIDRDCEEMGIPDLKAERLLQEIQDEVDRRNEKYNMTTNDEIDYYDLYMCTGYCLPGDVRELVEIHEEMLSGYPLSDFIKEFYLEEVEKKKCEQMKITSPVALDTRPHKIPIGERATKHYEDERGPWIYTKEEFVEYDFIFEELLNFCFLESYLTIKEAGGVNLCRGTASGRFDSTTPDKYGVKDMNPTAKCVLSSYDEIDLDELDWKTGIPEFDDIELY